MKCRLCAHRKLRGGEYPCRLCAEITGASEFEAANFFVPLPEGEIGKAMHADNVEHPAHYTGGSIECIDAMIETQGVEAVKDFCICNAFKYLWRHGKKNGVEDVKKAAWYLNKFVELEEKKGEA